MLTMTFMTSCYLNKRNKNHIGQLTGLLKSIFFPFTLLTVMLASCDQDPVNIGVDLLPEEDFIIVYSPCTMRIPCRLTAPG